MSGTWSLKLDGAKPMTSAYEIVSRWGAQMQWKPR
jgi:hypothetical protein